MAGSFTTSLRGEKALRDRLNAIAIALPDIMGQVMTEEAEQELTAAQARAPYLSGALRASGRVTSATITSERVSVGILFGGPTVPYARVQHERAYHHDQGERGYLARTLREAAPSLLTRIARRLWSRVTEI